MFLQFVSFCGGILESFLGCLHIDFSIVYTGEEGRGGTNLFNTSRGSDMSHFVLV